MPDMPHLALPEWFIRLLRDESGATAIEYAMIASLLSVAVLGSALLLGGGLQETWNLVKTEVMAALER